MKKCYGKNWINGLAKFRIWKGSTPHFLKKWKYCNEEKNQIWTKIIGIFYLNLLNFSKTYAFVLLNKIWVNEKYEIMLFLYLILKTNFIDNWFFYLKQSILTIFWKNLFEQHYVKCFFLINEGEAKKFDNINHTF